jgi:hypothetical protein
MIGRKGVGAVRMNFRWLGPVALLAVLFIGDQIRIHRPGHKYRLTLEVETPEGLRRGSSIVSVHPDRGYSRHGHTSTRGDAVFVDLGGGKNLVALMAHIDSTIDLDGMNYLALRAYKAAGRNVSFSEMSRMTGAVPVTGALIPVLVTFADVRDPASIRTVPSDAMAAAFGTGFRLHDIYAEVVPNGLWPLDFGWPLGEPVTRGIQSKLPWLDGPDNSSAIAIKLTGLPTAEAIDARDVFTRK